METHSITLAWRIPMDRGTWQAAVHGIAESDTTEQLNTAHYKICTGLTQIRHQSPVCLCENYLTSLGHVFPI